MVINIFFTGVTGYVGGSVLSHLLKFPTKYRITALVRSEEAVTKLRSLNVVPLLGSLNNAALVVKAVEVADMVIDTADSDNLDAAKAIVEGLSHSKIPKIFIHTSGTGVLSDGAKGDKASNLIYSDLDMKTIHSLPLTNPHRDVDQYLFEHSSNIKLIIVAPPIIYGLGTGQFNHHSMVIPRLIKLFAKLGGAAVYGKGINMWSSVHIEDLADFYLLLIEKALEGQADFGNEGWYFAEAADFQKKDLVSKLRDVLLKKNIVKRAEIRELSSAELAEHLGRSAYAMGCNSRSKGERSRALGWDPKRGDIFSSLEAQVDAMLEEGIIRADA